MMTSHVVRVRREALAACMRCPICEKLLRDATTISECLHTFCRKCIYKKLTDEEVDCCPICNIDLGCVPVEKLRPDHNLQDVRAKIFPFKRRKVKAPEVVPSFSLPVRRKERSLSSLVVSTPRVSTQIGLTGRRTKVGARKAAASRGSNFPIEGHIKKEADSREDTPESSSSPETLNKILSNRRQISSAETSNHHTPSKDSENGAETWSGKVDLWKPLNCLVEAANRTKSYKFNSQGSVGKTEQNNAPAREVHAHKTKGREHANRLKVRDEKNDPSQLSPELVKTRKMHRMNRKRPAAYRDAIIDAQAVLDTSSIRRDRNATPVWFKLVACEDQEGVAPLPQISASYLRIKDGNVPISSIQKYLVKKLNLTNEAEVEITCQGQPILPTVQLHNLVDLWLQTTLAPQRVSACVGTPAKDFVMVLAYGRKVQPP
ncbi:hypothetical protein Scep_029985 [Stephania cephalantha]|uniref:RING-type domain-containing protein n=1 Tax=Stephania cephalantha TaxID=152367 RepID=A0AAP0E6G3_9MAGN